MTDQRSAFRFRVPRLRPIPSPRPTTPTTQTTVRRPPRPQPQPAPAPTPQPRAPLPSPPPALPVRPPSPQVPATLPPTPPSLPLGTVPASSLEPSSVKPTPLLQVQTESSQTPPNRSLGTVPDSLPEPVVRPTPLPPPPPPASPPLPPVRSLGTVPDSPLEPQNKPSPPPQHEPSPTSSSSHSRIQSPVSSHPPSPSRTSTQPPSSPKLLESPPEAERSTKKASNDGRTDVNPATDPAPNDSINKVAGETKTVPQTHDETSTELSSDHSNSESQFKEKPLNKTHITQDNHHEDEKTKSILSHPGNEIPEPDYAENAESNGPQHEETTDNVHTEPISQIWNEKIPSVITLSGRNRGTSMHINSAANRRGKSIHITRRYKHNPDEITDTTDGEESSTEKAPEKENEDKNAYINCNIQGINNSMVFNCTITEKKPGVHLGSWDPMDVKKPKRKYIKLMDKNKVKLNISPKQKHTIRRRCLRGLFMESSDSDPNDPQKSRRHGCRYSSGEKSNKDDQMDVS
uniref:pollen-specific leucine-rich repeat extensin-like protein 1 n=1 Tax=Erigeron canadensis TaxID=72917 RepID=UPI001CB97247|nr:pollen-specific leucine-rich repeat extensin-like protein 1 [Erigeron canadensis]